MIQKPRKRVEYEEARNLRRDGLSYNAIARKTSIAKSTISLWCRDIELLPEQHKKLYTKQIEILVLGSQSSHERRIREVTAIVAAGEQEIKTPISSESYKLFGAALYWAEGSKTKAFSIVNSDPFLIKFITQWMYDILHLTPADLTAYLNIYPQQDDMLLKQFWSDITKIPLENFRKSFVKPLNKNYKKNTLYYGTITIKVRRGSNLRHRVFGWTQAVIRSVHAEVENVERKWHNLRVNYPRP